MRKHILFYIVLAVCTILFCADVYAQAQNITVTGTVVEKATNKIVIKVGSLGVITLLLCSNCVPKFQEVEQT